MEALQETKHLFLNQSVWKNCMKREAIRPRKIKRDLMKSYLPLARRVEKENLEKQGKMWSQSMRRMVTKCLHLAKKRTKNKIRSQVRMTQMPPRLGMMPQMRTKMREVSLRTRMNYLLALKRRKILKKKKFALIRRILLLPLAIQKSYQAPV